MPRWTLSFLRLSATHGWRPVGSLILAAGTIAGVGIGAVAGAGLIWIPVFVVGALLLVLLCGAAVIWDEADRRASANETKARQTDLLKKRNTELANELFVSQEQYKVLRNFRPPGR
jgi:hypothetical protein